MTRAEPALQRFFFADEPCARASRFARGLAAWTGVYVLMQLPHLEELYCRPILREGRFDTLVGPWPPPLPLVIALATLLLVALALVAADRGGRTARAGAAGLFAGLVALEASGPRAYAELAAIQWALVAMAPLHGPAPRWATRLMMLQLSTVYGFAALSKMTEGTGWWSGEALVWIFASERQGQHLLSASLPLKPGPLAGALAWSTMGLELLIAAGLWSRRARAPAAAALVLLHLAIAASMRVSLLFHALMLLHLLLFVGPRENARGLWALARRRWFSWRARSPACGRRGS